MLRGPSAPWPSAPPAGVSWIGSGENLCQKFLKQNKTLSYRPHMKIDLLDAIDAALAGDWHRAHKTVQQDEDDPLACWIHAVLHKIEGDAGNSRYWYSRTTHSYGEFSDVEQELAAIKREAESGR